MPQLKRNKHSTNPSGVQGDGLKKKETTTANSHHHHHHHHHSKTKKYRHELSAHTEVPSFLKRDHIISGYRFNYSAKLALITGFFNKHNETGNIYTHMFSLLFFAYLSYDTYMNLIWSAPFWEKVVFGVFLCSAMFTYLCSTIWHVFGCHSEKVYAITLSFDFMGIALLTTGSFVPPLYFTFHCHPNLRALYIGVIGSLGIFVSGMFVIPHFHSDRFKLLRTVVFCALAAFAVFPMVHSVILFGFERVASFIARLCIMFLFFALGLVFYVLKWPESLMPGYFDNWLHSHQLWHIFTFIGPLIHYFTILEVYTHYLANSNCEVLLRELQLNTTTSAPVVVSQLG